MVANFRKDVFLCRFEPRVFIVALWHVTIDAVFSNALPAGWKLTTVFWLMARHAAFGKEFQVTVFVLMGVVATRTIHRIGLRVTFAFDQPGVLVGCVNAATIGRWFVELLEVADGIARSE